MAVTAAISQAIEDQQEFEHDIIHRACRRYYEHCKRDHRLIEENNIKQDRRLKALNNRRHRLLNARKEVARKLLSAEDLLYMEGVVAALMSDEETDEEDITVWKVSPPTWRADKLTDMIKKCQGALEERFTYNSRLVHRRMTNGVVSLQEVPNGINPMYLKGI
ncbi:hypothetical protein AMECASPLE_029305 [Ameca splendens]|uniref:Uncharacterized protein n=1 Tax=Ameca splendens TaxID=208324 RepID=A0ABV0XIP1_9TELE